MEEILESHRPAEKVPKPDFENRCTPLHCLISEVPTMGPAQHKRLIRPLMNK